MFETERLRIFRAEAPKELEAQLGEYRRDRSI
jgi:hypothetical protein